MAFPAVSLCTIGILMSRLAAGIFLVFPSLAIADSDRPAAPLPDAEAAQVRTLIRKALDQQHIPGLTVAIAVDNALRFEDAFGLADVEHQVPTKTTTRFRTASIAKPMTSTVILRLFDDGRLDLDEPVQTYCEQFPEKRWPVTSRHLLGHLGGDLHLVGCTLLRSTYFPPLLLCLCLCLCSRSVRMRACGKQAALKHPLHLRVATWYRYLAR